MIRQCELKKPILFVEFDGQNWDEVDEIVGVKHKYITESAMLEYEQPNGGLLQVSEKQIVVRLDYNGLFALLLPMNKDTFEELFKVLPHPVEQKIIDDFQATEEM